MRVPHTLLAGLIWGHLTVLALAQSGGLPGNSEIPGTPSPGSAGIGQLLPPTPNNPLTIQAETSQIPIQTPTTPTPRPTPTTGGQSLSRGRLARSEMPPPPTAAISPSRTHSSGGWVTGEAALAGGPFPAYMTGYGFGQSTANWGGTAARPMERPFSSYSRPSSVSPYLNLYRPEGALGLAGNYYSLVRPMVEQQQVNRQLSQRLRQMEAVGPSPGGYTGSFAPTGGYFMNYYGFFPGLGTR